MAGKRRPAAPGLERLAAPLPRHHLLALQPTGDGAIPPGVGRISPVRLAELWLEHQPRELAPEEQLQVLVAEGRAQPAALLDVLRWSAAADRYYADVLEQLTGLARSIASEGVLQPIQIIYRDERWIVRDGHRRCLASLIAGQELIPATVVEEPTELAAIAHPLIVNLQRQDLTALEKGSALLRLALLVGRRRIAEQGGNPAGVTIAALLGAPAEDAAAATGPPATPAHSTMVESDGDGGHSTMVEWDEPSRRGAGTITGLDRALARQIREEVCAMTGLGQQYYYYLLALNRLVPEARALARGLPERRLRPIAGLPAARQAAILAFAEERRLSTDALATLCQGVRRGDEDEVQRVMARLRREERRPRAAPAWRALLYAIPADWRPRAAALRAELAALPPRQQRDRLAELARQIGLLTAAAGELRAIHDEGLARLTRPADAEADHEA